MIVINIDKAKAIGHDMRRAAREAEFKPLDDIIAKQIPGTAAQEAEAQRQLIREKYADFLSSSEILFGIHSKDLDASTKM
jgi:hypothetical protein